MSKVLVTGGLGFIGAHLVNNLLIKKHRVLIVDNESTIGGIMYRNPRCKFVNGNIINQSINLYGKQAIVATLPVKLKDKDLLVYDCAKATFRILDSNVLDFINESADEVMIIDVQNEGIDDKFNFRILEQLNINNEKLIISGGLGHKTIKQAKDLGIASCLIENRILQKENYIKTEL